MSVTDSSYLVLFYLGCNDTNKNDPVCLHNQGNQNKYNTAHDLAFLFNALQINIILVVLHHLRQLKQVQYCTQPWLPWLMLHKQKWLYLGHVNQGSQKKYNTAHDLAFLFNALQIEIILFVLHHPRQRKQVQYCTQPWLPWLMLHKQKWLYLCHVNQGSQKKYNTAHDLAFLFKSKLFYLCRITQGSQGKYNTVLSLSYLGHC